MVPALKVHVGVGAAFPLVAHRAQDPVSAVGLDLRHTKVPQQSAVVRHVLPDRQGGGEGGLLGGGGDRGEGGFLLGGGGLVGGGGRRRGCGAGGGGGGGVGGRGEGGGEGEGGPD
jgi:hypothetical protein